MRKSVLVFACIPTLVAALAPTPGKKRLPGDCPAFLDSLREAYRLSNPAYLAWEVDDRRCREIESQEGFYLQGLGFAILDQHDLAGMHLRRALIYSGPWREKALFELWRLARAQGDSVEAAADSIFMAAEFPESPWLTAMGGKAEKTPPLPAPPTALAQGGFGFRTRHEVTGTHSPSYARALLTDRAALDYSIARRNLGLKFGTSGEFASQPKAAGIAPDQFSLSFSAEARTGGWYGQAAGGQVYDFRPFTDSAGRTAGVQKGWAGPTGSFSTGYFDGLGRDWFWGMNFMAAQLRKNWRAYTATVACARGSGRWKMDFSGSGEWHVIHMAQPVFPGVPIQPAYDGFWSFDAGAKVAAGTGRHRPGVKVDYRHQRDRYTGADPLNLGPSPGRRQNIEVMGEYRYQAGKGWHCLGYLGPGYEVNINMSHPSDFTARGGLVFEWGR